MNFQELYNKVTKNWIFNEDNYPALTKLPLAFKRHFAINHIIQHQYKALAKVTAMLEDQEHKPIDNHITITYKNRTEVLEAVWRLQVNTLKLAEIAGISADEVLDKVNEYLAKGE